MTHLVQRTPTAFRPKAQGRREATTLGKLSLPIINPNRVEAATPLGLNYSRVNTQGSLRQPWAGGLNAFGVLRKD